MSRSALERAEAQLVADGEGVRDEVGVLALHTVYANRFFPGTSVQQTRLRYALFVPWQIMALLRERIQSGQARRELDRAELNLARRLPDVDGEGTIGRRTAQAGRLVAVPPSQSYRVALGAWGILNTGSDGDAPSLVTSSLPAGEVGPRAIAAGRRPTTRGLRWRRRGPCFIRGFPSRRPTSIVTDRSISSSGPANGRSCAHACSTRGVPETANPPSCRRWCGQGTASGTVNIPGHGP